MVNEEPKQQQRTPEANGRKIGESLFTPRFKSVAAMAGWDEEALLVATLVVEDTPDRDVKQRSKKRCDVLFKSPSSASLRRKHKSRRRSTVSAHVPVPVPVLNLDEEETPDSNKENSEGNVVVDDEKRKNVEQLTDRSSEVSCSRSAIPCMGKLENKKAEKNDAKSENGELAKEKSEVSCSKSALPCMDKLREELSCAICLDICFEPSTTSCGHSFCKQCLRSAASKCGKKCPKCRQLNSSGRSCHVNTVLWNTIQLLFPQEIEARKEAVKASNCEEAEKNRSLEREATPNQRRSSSNYTRTDSERESSNISSVLRSRNATARARRGIVSQESDAALALRLQREEFLGTYRRSGIQSFNSARENLRAMASRALNSRIRHHPV